MNRAGKQLTALAVLICVMAIASAALASPPRMIREIQRPLFSAPAIVKAGSSFDLIMKLDGDRKPAQTTLVAVADSYSVVGVKLTESGEAAEGKLFKAAIPANAPEALYDLRVYFSDGTSDMQPHAVKIVKDFKEDYDFVHLTDIHFNDPHFPDRESNLVRIKLMYEIAKVNPEFIIFGGDLGLNPETYDRDFSDGYRLLNEYIKSPIFMEPGNHEQYTDGRTKPVIDGRPYWESVYGPYYQSFNYGKLHFIGLNTFDWDDQWRDRYDPKLAMTGAAANGCIRPAQFEWLKKDLQAATAAGETPIVFTHVPIAFLQGGKKLGYAPPVKIKGPSPEDFSKLMEEFKVPYVFVGHMHYNYDNNKLNPVTTEIMTEAGGTNTSGVDDPQWGFRIVHVRNGVITGSEVREISYNSAMPKN
jgi:hypothetical protein